MAADSSKATGPGIGAHLAVGLIRSVNFVYDVVTLPIYTVLQRPWNLRLARYCRTPASDKDAMVDVDRNINNGGIWSEVPGIAGVESGKLTMPSRMTSRSLVYAAPLEKNDPHSPWAPTSPTEFEIFDGVTTVDQLIRRAIELHGEKDALGSRAVRLAVPILLSVV